MAAVVHGEGPGMYVTGTEEEIREWQDAYAKANGLPTREDRAERYAARMKEWADDLEWLDREIADAEHAAILSRARGPHEPGDSYRDAELRMAAGERALRLRRLREALR